jgi:hypothetical protein
MERAHAAQMCCCLPVCHVHWSAWHGAFSLGGKSQHNSHVRLFNQSISLLADCISAQYLFIGFTHHNLLVITGSLLNSLTYQLYSPLQQ